MRFYRLAAALLVVLAAFVSTSQPTLAATKPNGGPPSVIITPELIARSQHRGEFTIMQAAGGCGGTAAWWFDTSVGSGTNAVASSTNFSFCKINGATDNFFVDMQGTAYTLLGGYYLTAYEGWMYRNISTAVLRDRSPQGTISGQNEGAPINFGLAYGDASASVSFPFLGDSYTPFIRSRSGVDGDWYSVKWGHWSGKSPNTSVANGSVSRWSGGRPDYQFAVGNCGNLKHNGLIYVWGACDRSPW
jgi:hypothetical protein